MMTLTVDEDLLTDLDTVVEYLERAGALLTAMDFHVLAGQLAEVAQAVELEIGQLENALEAAE